METPLKIKKRSRFPLLKPLRDYEAVGIEDPRIVKIDDLFYLTYTAFDGNNALGALATSKDMVKWKKQGIVVPQITYEEFKHFIESKGSLNEKYIRYNNPFTQSRQANENAILWDKNVIFFPRRIHGKLYFMHRVRPDIQLVIINDISELTVEFWQHYFLHLADWIMMTAKYPHEASYIGGGCPPIETKDGWLIIYHAVRDTVDGYVYTACAALFDIDNPLIEISRLPIPLFSPEESYEKEGYVNNVCFPTGAIVQEDTLYVYYGAADERIACASMSLNALLSEFKKPYTYGLT
jgi:predicted GH43/DUF377 family glycosyl hydrolase